MQESQLYELLISEPDLIEEGLTYLRSQVRIHNYRCDLLFLDKNGRELYVEVKLKVDDKAVGQLMRYDGLVSKPYSRFMLAGLTFVHGLKEALAKHGYEYKQIILEGHQNSAWILEPKLTKGESAYKTAAGLISSFKSLKVRQFADEIYDFCLSLPDSYYYLSDGIMFKRKRRKYKYLSISTRGDRVLFHVPINRRDEVLKEYSSKVKVYEPIDTKDKNQIDIKLGDIESIEVIYKLILLSYNERE